MFFFSAGEAQVQLYPGKTREAPLICLLGDGQRGAAVYAALQTSPGPDFTLAVVSGMDWNRDLSPWPAPSAFPGRENFSGGGPSFLRHLAEDILPRAESLLPSPVSWRGIAGYSLAGLFALWSLYSTDLFSRAASISGSLWYPELKGFLASQSMPHRPDCLYFSLGKQECKTRNPLLRTVQSSTEETAAFFQAQGISTVFRLHPGNHFTQPEARMAAAIAWLLSPCTDKPASEQTL